MLEINPDQFLNLAISFLLPFFRIGAFFYGTAFVW
jgi:flagellar biosynthetic protein FliR